jgi:hypothetical protein
MGFVVAGCPIVSAAVPSRAAAQTRASASQNLAAANGYDSPATLTTNPSSSSFVASRVYDPTDARTGRAVVEPVRSSAAEGGAGALDDLSASGAELDPADAGGQLTRAGRALAKAKEVFGPTAGGPAAINRAGQNALDEILTNPGTAERIMRGGNFAGGKVFISPDGIGAVFSPSGEFEYFGRMPYP